ncbi:MAG TPA: peptidoglycan-binding domain-containing protein [Azospirillaceae bacterium]|nr:peptidoglycan-binding domain-containing protein [Azospirillaceae bacterium]
MTNGIPGSRFGRGAVFALAVAAGLTLTGVAKAEPSAADIQWAQTVLNEKGFKVGRPIGRMTPETKQGLSAYQKSVGLKQSGELDAATIAKMMESRPAANTMKTLGAPDPSRPRVNSNAPEPKPQAAPVMGVQSAGGDGDTVIGTVRRAGVPEVSASSGYPGAPSAAPRVGVASESTAPMPGQTVMPDEPFRLMAPGWMRFGIIGFIAAAFGFAGWWWWSSGRRPAPTERPAMTRREPTLCAGEPSGARRGPMLSARGGGSGGGRRPGRA